MVYQQYKNRLNVQVHVQVCSLAMASIIFAPKQNHFTAIEHNNNIDPKRVATMHYYNTLAEAGPDLIGTREATIFSKKVDKK